MDSLASDSKAVNVARENKAYSYKEQMEEEALRQEIMKKKAKEGKVKAPELSAKQKEAMRLQLEKESEVRVKVTALLASCSPVLELLEAVVEASPEVLAPHLTQLLPVLHGAVKRLVLGSYLLYTDNIFI